MAISHTIGLHAITQANITGDGGYCFSSLIIIIRLSLCEHTSNVKTNFVDSAEFAKLQQYFALSYKCGTLVVSVIKFTIHLH